MPPKQGKAKKVKGASASPPLTKQMNKAAKCSQVPETLPETLVQGLGVTEGDEEGWATEDKVSATTQEVMAEKMDS